MDNLREYTIVDEGDLSPSWKKNSENGETLVKITGRAGFGEPPLLGSVRLFLGDFNVVNYTKPKLRIRHAMKFNFEPGPTKVQIRKKCEPAAESCENFWSDLVFPVGVLDEAFIDDLETSSWIDVPVEFTDSDFEISLFYKAVEKPNDKNDNTPEWRFRSLQVGGLK